MLVGRNHDSVLHSIDFLVWQRTMRRTPLSISGLLLVATSLVAGCQRADDGEQSFRGGYTTNITLSGGDGGGQCNPPSTPVDVDPRRSLFETNQVALAQLDLESILTAIASNGGLTVEPDNHHDQLMDTYNTAAMGIGLGQNCDDQLDPNGEPELNGYPLACPRAEGSEVGNINDWFPIAAVNRFDLAPSDGANCGEARIVLANSSGTFDRVFAIFEAKIPNPDPGCGISACAPVQHFWASLSTQANPGKRAQALAAAFLTGHPKLTAAGFEPFMRFANFVPGAGQIRTNNFKQSPWTLREFKLTAFAGQPAAFDAIDAQNAVMRFIEVPVAANPFGELWNDNSVLQHSTLCQEALVDTVESLMTDNVNLMGVSVPPECLAAESRDTLDNNYPFHLASGSGSLTTAINDAIQTIDPGSALTADHIARRARFSGACIGCHQQSNGDNLGNEITAPNSGFFVHTDERPPFEDCGDGNISCFRISPAVRDAFLPHREEVMETYLNSGPCCEGPVIGPIQPAPLPFPFPQPLPLDPPQPFQPQQPGVMEAFDVEAFIALDEAAKASLPPTTIAGTPIERAH